MDSHNGHPFITPRLKENVQSIPSHHSPKVGFAELLQIESLIIEGGHVQYPLGGEHVAPLLQPLLGMQVCLQHPLIEQHVAHRLRDYHVHLLRDINLKKLKQTATTNIYIYILLRLKTHKQYILRTTLSSLKVGEGEINKKKNFFLHSTTLWIVYPYSRHSDKHWFRFALVQISTGSDY